MSYFNHEIANEPGKGKLLVSEPFLPDPNFTRTVVLLCEHNPEGTFGFVLNKPSLLRLEDVLEDVAHYSGLLYVGGPVQQDTLHFIHNRKDIDGGVEIAKGIYWGGNFEKVLIMLRNNQVNAGDFRFFLGYSGWGGGQLMDELSQNSWIVSDVATPQQIFGNGTDSLWKEVLREMGGKYKMISNYPIDPRLN